jgi:hypothetical protein
VGPGTAGRGDAEALPGESAAVEERQLLLAEVGLLLV